MTIVNPGTAIKRYVDSQKTKVAVTPALTSGTKIASISVDGVSKDLYCVKDTDTKVTQTHSTANAAYPILLKDGTGTGTVTNGALFDGDVSVNPSTSKITAKAFVGALEGTATKATNDDEGRHIPSYYWRIDDVSLGDAYTMTKEDWNGSVPIRRRVSLFKTAAESPDGLNIGDYYLYNLGHVDSAGYATILAVSPRIEDRLFTGHFWNGTWIGWKEISLSKDTVKDLSISGKTITVTKGDGTTSTLTTQDTVPTVGNATLSIQKNGTSVGTFTANATANKSINITVPTKVSELTNDSDYAKKTEAVGSVTRDPNDAHKIIVKSISTAFENSFATADTLNTAGCTDLLDKKLFLVGAQSQGANPQTYSNKNCYIEDNLLYSGGSEVYTKSNLVQATIDTPGLMSGTHVAKLSSIEEGANKYELPMATSTTLGGVKIGPGLTINNGVLSAPASAENVDYQRVFYYATLYTYLPAVKYIYLQYTRIAANCGLLSGTVLIKSTDDDVFNIVDLSYFGDFEVKLRSPDNHYSGNWRILNKDMTMAMVGYGPSVGFTDYTKMQFGRIYDSTGAWGGWSNNSLGENSLIQFDGVYVEEYQ